MDIPSRQGVHQFVYTVVFIDKLIDESDRLLEFIVGVIFRQKDGVRLLALQNRIEDFRNLIEVFRFDALSTFYQSFPACFTSNRQTLSPEHQQSTSLTSNARPVYSESSPLMKPSS